MPQALGAELSLHSSHHPDGEPYHSATLALGFRGENPKDEGNNWHNYKKLNKLQPRWKAQTLNHVQRLGVKSTKVTSEKGTALAEAFPHHKCCS